MEIPIELSNSFDCRATAAVLRSGSTVELASHVAALMSLIPIAHNGPAAWISLVALLPWCASVYLSLRVKIDAALFELLASQPPENLTAQLPAAQLLAAQLDTWLESAGLKKQGRSRTIADRRRGALRLWRALLFTVAVQIALVLLALVLFPHVLFALYRLPK